MRLETLRDRIIGLILDENPSLSREFVQANWDYLKHYVDESINKFNKFLIIRRPSRWYLTFQVLVIFSLVYLFQFKLQLELWKSLAIISFIILNMDFIYYKDLQRLVHLIYVKFNYKVKNYCSIPDRFGYTLVYLATDPEDFKRVIVLSAFKPKRNIKYVNHKLYIVNRRSLHSMIIDYKTNKNSASFEDIKYDVFLSINQEYINFRVIQGLETIRDV